MSFGGLSGVSNYGGCMDIAESRDYPLRFISDRGWFYYTSLRSGGSFQSASLGTLWVKSAISDETGLDVLPPYEDAESITCLKDKSCLVSFEQFPRLHVYDRNYRRSQIVIEQRSLASLGLHRNGGFEAALPLDSKYLMLFGIAEDPTESTTQADVRNAVTDHTENPTNNIEEHLAVWMRGRPATDNTVETTRSSKELNGRIACTARYRGIVGYFPTDAKYLPGSNGQEILVLERYYERKTGNRSRVVRVPLLACDTSETETTVNQVSDRSPRTLGVLRGESILELGNHEHIDNFEGLVVWPHCDQKGYDLGLVSDNNFSSSQETVWLQLRHRD